MLIQLLLRFRHMTTANLNSFTQQSTSLL